MQKLWHFLSQNCKLEEISVTCIERVKQFYPKRVYQLGETLYDKVNAIKML